MAKPLRPAKTPQGRARALAGLSLRQVEAATGVNRGAISMWERGRMLLDDDQQRRILELYDQYSRP